jgi:hypothetical protein
VAPSKLSLPSSPDLDIESKASRHGSRTSISLIAMKPEGGTASEASKQGRPVMRGPSHSTAATKPIPDGYLFPMEAELISFNPSWLSSIGRRTN